MTQEIATKTRAGSQITGDVEARILEALRAIRYGSVEIVIHDSKVVQIELREKVRFGPSANGTPGS